MSALEWGCPPEPLVEVLAAIDACTATTDLVVRLGLEQAAQREERLSQELHGHLDTWDGGW